MRIILVPAVLLLFIEIGLAQTSTDDVKSIAAIALFNERAMISVNGKKAKIVRAGSTYSGVKVISSTTSEAVVEVEGQQRTLKLNGTALIGGALGVPSQKKEASSIILYENNIGFFESDGQINGRNIRFLIDTGANLVVFSSQDAERLGIDYLDGDKGIASTASGQAAMYGINIDSIDVGGIALRNIRAGVINGSFPETPLLGMSFLSHLDMNRTGTTMVLKKR